MMLAGWGRYPALDCRLERLRRREDLPGLLHRGTTLIARGNGRSYGDAALNPELTLSMLAMDRMRAFDAGTGRLDCEAGVLLADFLETFAPRGWFPPVVPGTRLVTVGGMIAADVHGKNHHRDGTFGAHMERGALPPGLASNPLRPAPAGKLRVPADAPSALLNRVSIGLFNALCYRRERARARAGAPPRFASELSRRLAL